MQVSRGEPIADTALVLSRYLDVIAIRTYDQAELEEFACYATIPVINALTDRFHPCQIMADLLTIQEAFGQLQDLTLAYCGDGNNVAHSLLLGCAMTGIHIRVATLIGFVPEAEIVEQSRAIARSNDTGSQIARSLRIQRPPSPEPRWSTPMSGPAWNRKKKPSNGNRVLFLFRSIVLCWRTKSSSASFFRE